jgi:hypothetical protein
MTVTITGRGWFLFCPIWLPEGWEDEDTLAPLPRGVPWLVLDAALEVQQFLNFLISFFDPDACGFMAMVESVEPFEMERP